MNNLKAKISNLVVVTLKTVPTDFKKLSDVVSKEVAKNTKFNKLDTKVNNLENKTPDASCLVQRNKYDADKKSLEKKIEVVDESTWR